MDILELSERNQQIAWKIIEETRIIPIWENIGAEVNLVGSLKTGLLVKHRDIDLHVYSAPLSLSDSFSAIAKLAHNPRIRRVEYVNLIDTEEKCIEWHAWYENDDHQLWQMDMIHILKGSAYDGYFEKVAERISAVLTEETRQTILRLKYETPDADKIMGIEYYQAVIRDGVRTYSEFMLWRQKHPADGVIKWMP